MERSGEGSQEGDQETATTAGTVVTAHHESPPAGLTWDDFGELVPAVKELHTYSLPVGRQCSSLLAQRIHAPRAAVWSIVRRFDRPQVYKHFIKSCSVSSDFTLAAGCTRYVSVITGLPAETSEERLDILDENRCITGFSIIGGEHRLSNYRSVTSLHEIHRGDKVLTVVLESYVVDVPPGNTEEDTRMFADTVVKLNLQKLADITEGKAAGNDSPTTKTTNR